MRYSHAFVLTLSLLLIPAAALFAGGQSEAEENGEEIVNVYSHRHYEIDQRLYERFTEKTGIEVNVVNAGSDELIQRLKSEGELSPADILVTADAGRLVRAEELGLLQAVDSETLENRIPSHLRDSEGKWFGLTKRARVIVYHKERVDPSELSTIEALAAPEWKNRIAIRSSANVYNQSLLASLIAHHGKEEAERWARRMVENMARSPQGNDRDQMKAVAAGTADVAVVNTYYVGRMLTSDTPEEVQVAEQLGVFFPNQEGRGAHINISGAGVTAHAPHKANAVKLLEFLTSEEAQSRYAKANFEYPAVPEVKAAELVRSWGEFKEDTLPLSKLGELNEQAVKIFDRAGWK